MGDWWFAHPTALLALLAVPILLWRARTGEQGELEWTGALEIWRRAVPAVKASESEKRRGVPLFVIAGLLALVLGTLALANPQRKPARSAPARWILVLDRSPSMFLPAQPVPSAPSRIERAVELALGCCERAGVGADAREWSTYAFDGVHASRGERPPTQWLDPRWGPGARTPWAQLDTPEHLWVSDCEPNFAPLQAGRVQCGASATFGAVADLGPRCLAWDGQRLFEKAWDEPRLGVFVGADLPEEIAMLAQVWADERQLPRVSKPAAACLRIARADVTADAAELDGKLIGESWSVDARARPSSAVAEFTTWAEFEDRAGKRSPAVQWRPGEIRIALTSLAAAAQDPAVFAITWVALFDRARLSEPAVVALTERMQSGPEVVSAPGARAERGPGDVQSFAPHAALLACLLALAALALVVRRPTRTDPRKHPPAAVRSPARAGLG